MGMTGQGKVDVVLFRNDHTVPMCRVVCHQ
jgi:hypothetical protein